MIINYYESGITAIVRPNKKPPIEYDPSKEHRKNVINRNNHISKDNNTRTIDKLEVEEEIKKARKAQIVQTKKYAKIIMEIIILFGIFFLLSYQSSLVSTSLNEKEKLKTELAGIQKKNEQLKVNIEQKTNINTVEQEAKEELGMQKLDNNQKVYINIDKNDYTESSTLTNKNSSEKKSWWNQFISDLFNKQK